MSKKKRKVAPRQRCGVCRLTGRQGRFVKSHIIPEALSTPRVRGGPLVQFSPGGKPSQAWTSWYDPFLVTREGEEILRDLDSFGVAELRRLKLVWSGWEVTDELALYKNASPEDPVTSTHISTQETPFIASRVVEVSDVSRLRRFLLSLLWRVAASDMPQFAHVRIPNEPLSAIKSEVLGNGVCHAVQFSPYLVQFITKGKFHNRTPDFGRLDIPSVTGGKVSEHYADTVRLYLDGLIIHFIYDLSKDFPASFLDSVVIRDSQKIVLAALPFEGSRSGEELAEVLAKYLGQSHVTDHVRKILFP